MDKKFWSLFGAVGKIFNSYPTSYIVKNVKYVGFGLLDRELKLGSLVGYILSPHLAESASRFQFHKIDSGRNIQSAPMY